MAYEEFTIDRVEKEFAVIIKDVTNLFATAPVIQPSPLLLAILEDFIPLGSSIGTEKARSEFIIAPILAAVKKIVGTKVHLFSGNRFDVDKEKGLTGYCDFILSFSLTQLSISAPVVTIVEAKNENIHLGIGQCMAEMIAAQIYNRSKNNHLIDTIYGCVTTGSVWRFLQLHDTTISLDNQEYYLDQLPKILGIFVTGLQKSGI